MPHPLWERDHLWAHWPGPWLPDWPASMSAQAVGGAVGHNPISILIPCHRVVGADGSLTGYAGGIDKKLWLLDHEGVETDRFFVPDNSTAP